MALLYMDSFDHYVTADLTEKWTTISGSTINSSAGRRATAGLRLAAATAYALRTCAAGNNTIVVGVALRGTLGAASSCLAIWDGAASRNQVILQLNTDGTITAFRGGTGTNPGQSGSAVSLGVSSVAFAANVAGYLEARIVLHDSAGEVVLRVNGSPILTLTGIDTINTTATWSGVALCGSSSSSQHDFDDLYVLDGSGAAPWNAFLGDCRVDARLPTAPGATTGWTPSTGANWQAVDDAAPDDDTTYTESSTPGATDSFVYQDAPVPGAILYGIQHNLAIRKTDAGGASIAPIVRASGIDYPGTALSPGTTYAFATQIAQVNPATGLQWNESEFNAAEFGYRRVS